MHTNQLLKSQIPKLNYLKSQSFLPTLSLAELQENYHLLKNKKKNIHKHYLSNLSNHNLIHEDLKIKSPFYDRSKCINHKFCKCEFHKKKRNQIESKFQFMQKQNYSSTKINNIPKLQTLGNQNTSSTSKQNKLSHKRFKSLVNEESHILNRKSLLQQIKNRKSQFNNTQELYIEYLKRLKQDKSAYIDCHNADFEEFLKTNDQWILRQLKNKNNSKIRNSMISQITLNQSTKSRFKTAPSNHQDGDQNKLLQDKYMKLNIEDMKKQVRRKNKKNTEVSFSGDDENTATSKSRFMHLMQNLTTQDKNSFQNFIKSAYKELGMTFDPNNTDNYSDPNFFSTLCKNLLSADSTIVQQTKNILRRISRLPLQLFDAILKEIKMELKQGFETSLDLKAEDMQKAVNLALQTIEKQVQTMVKKKQQQQGKQKLSIVGKLKTKYTGRQSMNFYKILQNRNKLRFSNSESLDSKSNNDSKKGSRFAIQKIQTNESEQQIDKIQITSIDESNQNDQRQAEQMTISDMLNKQKGKQLKKGSNLKKKKKNQNIMKKIDEEIQKSNNKGLVLVKNPSETDDKFLKERAQSRKRLRDEESKKHLQFLANMKQKQLERQSSTMSECEMKKNNLRAHYQRNKIFLKKMEISLVNNSQLKQMIINYQDDLFTKKRKVRILKNMISDHKDQESQFCKDIKKYVQIYQKNCNMIVGKDNWARFKFKNYTKRLLGSSKYFDYEIPEDQLAALKGMEDLNQLLKMDNELKFYSVRQVHMEEEDYESLQTNIASFTTQLIKHTTRHRNIWLPTKQNKYLFQTCDQNQGLVQVGLQQKVATNELNFDKFNKEKSDSEEQSQNLESENIRKIVNRFNNNMKRYQKILKNTEKN